MMTHFTDKDIQNLLDGNPVANTGWMKQHLVECAVCRESYEAYRALIPVLSDDISLHFRPDFTDRLLARISVTESRKKVPAWAIVQCGLIAMGGAVYGLSLLLPRLVKQIAMFRPVFSEIQAAGNSVSSFLSRNFGSPALIVAAFSAIGLVMLMDRFFIQPRLHSAKTH